MDARLTFGLSPERGTVGYSQCFRNTHWKPRKDGKGRSRGFSGFLKAFHLETHMLKKLLAVSIVAAFASLTPAFAQAPDANAPAAEAEKGAPVKPAKHKKHKHKAKKAKSESTETKT